MGFFSVSKENTFLEKSNEYYREWRAQVHVVYTAILMKKNPPKINTYKTNINKYISTYEQNYFITV